MMKKEDDLISVIVPIHNGSKYIKRLYNVINNQCYNNLEIIFVENYSKDNSMEMLLALSKNDNRVIVLESKKQGTSYARKMGVEKSTGRYIVFMDQDDWLINNDAIKNMYSTIIETHADICQFNVYKYYGKGIKRKTKDIGRRRLFTAEDIRGKEIGSIFESYGCGYLTTSVWSKIYSSAVLKDAVKRVNYSLFVAEDLFLNTCCFLSDKLHLVCVDPNAYYIWDTRYGFSKSNESGFKLIREYSIIKPQIHNKLVYCHCSSNILFRLHIESLYYAKIFLISKIYNMDYNEALNLIEEINNMEYILLAKWYMNNLNKDGKFNEELKFLSSDYSSREFYEKYNDSDSSQEKSALKKFVKRILK